MIISRIAIFQNIQKTRDQMMLLGNPSQFSPKVNLIITGKWFRIPVIFKQKWQFSLFKPPDGFAERQVHFPDGANTIEGFLVGNACKLIENWLQRVIGKKIFSKYFHQFALVKEWR